MEETGKIVSIDGGKMVIEICANEACSKCCSCGASGVRTIDADSVKEKGFEVGDNVKISLQTAIFMRMNILLYLAPLIVFAGVTLAAYGASGSPGKSFLAGSACTGLVYFAAGKIIKKDKRFAPEIIKIDKQKQEE
ncbi:MAG: SoxR reducing system RseC family protein [Candidatus Aadella gelida]|nr:SoxR reducing system RseC family protein [Candidatus Aadella gelida]